MSILDKKFQQYLAKEGLQPKTQDSLNMLKRAYYSGATDFYHSITKATREAKIVNPNSEEKQLKASNKMLEKLQSSITQYWKEQLLKQSKNKSEGDKGIEPTKPKLTIVKK